MLRLRRMTTLLALGLLVLTFLAMAGTAGAATATVQLAPQNNSGITGTATLEDVAGGKTKVTVTITGAPAGSTQPAHLHEGTCANLTATPKYPLTSLANGKSETTIDGVTVADLMAKPFAVNLHKSPQEASVYVSCGNVTQTAGAAPAAAPRTGAGGMADQSSPLLYLAVAGWVAVAVLGSIYMLRRRA